MGSYRTMILVHGETLRKFRATYPDETKENLGRLIAASHPLAKLNGKGFYSGASIEGALGQMEREGIPSASPQPPVLGPLGEAAEMMQANQQEAMRGFFQQGPPQEINTTLPDFGISDFPFPDGEWQGRKPYKIEGKRALVMNDIHLSKHVNGAIKAAIDAGREFDVDTVILNGDTLELDRPSRWQSKPNSITIEAELKLGREFLALLRKLFPSAEIIFHQGNHDLRVEQYILRNAPEIYSLGFHNLEQLLEMDKHGVTYVDQFTIMKFGKLCICHGHLLPGGGINVAANKFKNAGTSVMFAHHHVSQEHTKRDLNGDIHGAWAVGCLSELSPEFSPVNNWTWGFALVERDDNHFKVQNKQIELLNGEFIVL